MRRFNFNLKHMLVCMAALLSPQFQLAGVYPLVPALFMTGFVCGVNRSLLFLCSICGLLILAPVSVMVKYALIILLSAALVRDSIQGIAAPMWREHCVAVLR